MYDIRGWRPRCSNLALKFLQNRAASSSLRAQTRQDQSWGQTEAKEQAPDGRRSTKRESSVRAICPLASWPSSAQAQAQARAAPLKTEGVDNMVRQSLMIGSCGPGAYR